MRYRRIKSLDDLKTGTLIISSIGTICVVKGIVYIDSNHGWYIKVLYIGGYYWYGEKYPIKNSIYSLDFLMREYRLLTKNI